LFRHREKLTYTLYNNTYDYEFETSRFKRFYDHNTKVFIFVPGVHCAESD